MELEFVPLAISSKEKLGNIFNNSTAQAKRKVIMSEFYQGVIAAVGILGGLCAFNYWAFGMMEKRIEDKIDKVGSDISTIANELREERRSKDYLYKFVLDNVKDKK